MSPYISHNELNVHLFSLLYGKKNNSGWWSKYVTMNFDECRKVAYKASEFICVTLELFSCTNENQIFIIFGGFKCFYDKFQCCQWRQIGRHDNACISLSCVQNVLCFCSTSGIRAKYIIFFIYPSRKIMDFFQSAHVEYRRKHCSIQFVQLVVLPKPGCEAMGYIETHTCHVCVTKQSLWLRHPINGIWTPQETLAVMIFYA